LAVVAAIVIVYAVLSYYSDATPNALNLAAGLSLGPVVLIGAVVIWRWTHPLIAMPILALVCAALYHYWGFFTGNYQWSNLVQQAGVYALVALSFLRSLWAGRVPVCTLLAEKLHGPLEQAEIVYTRRATVAWALFYALLTAAVLVLFFAAAPRIWSAFVNFATYALIGLMFVAEHAVRRILLPHTQHRSILTALREFLGG
jgi:uncharacterized membrane protein